MRTFDSRVGLLVGAMVGSLALVAEAAPKVSPKAAPVSATVAAVPAAATDKSARVSLLDKQTNRRQVLVLIAGNAQVAGSIQIKLTKCLPDYAAVLGQDVAWLDVTEGAGGSGRTAPWFSGWMFNTYPEVSTLDHARYDVQLQGCGVKARQVVRASGKAPIVDSTPVVDTETSNDAPVDGTDPYFVPGVGKPAEAAPVQTPAAEAPVDTEAAPDNEPPSSEAAPIVEPVPPTAPAEPAPQEDLHRMMDSGTY